MCKQFTQEKAEIYYSTDILKLIGKYSGSKIQTKYKCLCGLPKCMNVFLATPSYVKAGRTKCCNEGRKRALYTQKEAKQYFSTDKLKMVGKYINANTPVRYKCLLNLSGCKKICYITPYNVRRGNTTSCGCSRRYKCLNDISYIYYQKIYTRAQKKNLQFDLTIEFLQELLEKQNYKCALSGIPIILSKNFYNQRKKTEQTGSLDRIDSKKGYVENNVQWVHKDINKMKMNLSQKRFFELCDNVTQLQRIK